VLQKRKEVIIYSFKCFEKGKAKHAFPFSNWAYGFSSHFYREPLGFLHGRASLPGAISAELVP
jgi:hypothetical protein